MLETSQGARLLKEAGKALRVPCRIRRQELERHVLPHLFVDGSEDLPHTATTEQVQQSVGADVGRKGLLHGSRSYSSPYILWNQRTGTNSQ